MSDLIRVSHGIWRPASTVNDLVGRAAAVLSGCAAGTVIAGRTAAILHGLWLPGTDAGPVEVVMHAELPVPSSRPHTRRAELLGRRCMLAPEDVTSQDGLPIMTPARTWLDLARLLDNADLVAAGDSALRAGATVDELAALIERARHRPGVVRARAVLPYLDARSRSRPESHLRYLLVSGGLPWPDVNQAIYSVHGEWLAEPDLSYKDVRLAIEYNGADHASPPRMRKDITRELDVDFRGGWRMITFGPVEVFRRGDQVVAMVRQLRTERMAGR